MALSDVFAAPLGLAAIAALIPLVVLYLIQPDPRRMDLPTFRFLTEDSDERGANPIVERLRRNVLLLLQILAVLLLAVALASPYIVTTQAASAEATVVVVDASASMATDDGDGPRFATAIGRAQDAVGTPTTLVVAGATTEVVASDVAPAQARSTLSELSATDAPGDLRGAIGRARALADDEGRIVVVSDFAGESEWQSAVQAARAEGIDVTLERVGGRRENVGIVARQFDGQRVTFTVKNTGTEPAERTLEIGDLSRSISLQPGDVTTVSVPMPAESTTARLRPNDAFETDDVAHVTVPETRQVRALVVTNRENRYLQTALEVVPTVDVTVSRPPSPIDGDYDVVVFSGVDRDRLLRSTVETSRDILEDGGGVAIQAQPDVASVGYGDTLPVATEGVRNTSDVGAIRQHRLTRGFDFPAPERHLTGTVRRGTPLVETADGSPLLATARRSGGRVLYYGYMPDQPAFRYSYRYPVFWREASHWLASRPALSDLNRRTGETFELGNRTTVRTPTGERRGSSIRLDAVGVYRTDDRRASASLLSASESNVTAPALDISTGGSDRSVSAGYLAERDLTPLAVLLVLAVVLGELAYLRYRGDV